MAKLAPVALPASGLATIGILDRNRVMLGRAARIASAVAGLTPVACDTEPAGLRAQLSPDTTLLLCGEQDLQLALEWTETRFRRASIIVWSAGAVTEMLAGAANPKVKAVIGWPSFLSMPRPWELALAIRYALRVSTSTLELGELFAGTPVSTKYAPCTSRDRDAITSELVQLAERAGATDRMLSRIGEVGHELVMNAMYDAPVNHYGEARYAHDRRAELVLEDHEVPIVRFATDGFLLALQAADPFGRLTREHVLGSVARGLAAGTGGAALDTSNGGAGLGLWKIFSSSAVTILDVIPGHATSMTAVFDLDIGAREMRTMPPSLHFVDRR